VVSALRAFDARLRQRLRDLIEDECLARLLLTRPRDLRDLRVFAGDRPLIPAGITVQFPIRGEHEGATLRTEHGGDSKTGGACDKKVPGNLELGVVVVSEDALDELLDRALVGLAAYGGRAGRWLGPRLVPVP